MRIDEYLEALREADDAATMDAAVTRGPADHRPAPDLDFPPEILWTEPLRRHLHAQNARGLLHLQFMTEKYYSGLLGTAADPDHQNRILALAYARVVDFQLLRNEPDMGFSVSELRFVVSVAKRVRRQAARDPLILEIGCGVGSLLSSLAARGFREIAGLDLALKAVDSAREKLRAHGLADRVRQGTPNDLVQEGPTGHYDLVLACDVIEHIPPALLGAFLADVRQLLARNGTLVVVTPNALTGPHDVTRHFRPAGAPPEGLHLREYQLRELVRLLGAAGFPRVGGAYPWPSPEPVYRIGLGRASLRLKLAFEPVLALGPAPVRATIVRSLFYAGVVARKDGRRRQPPP